MQAEAYAERRRELLDALRREHIREGFALAVGAKGYTATTIADIARAARVSKSTIYEHFADKEAIYLDLHATVAEALHTALTASVDRTAGDADWTARVRALVRARLEVIAETPAFLAQAAVEPEIAGEAARKAREAAGRRSARVWARLSEQIAGTTDEVAPLSEHLAFAGLAAGVAFVGAAARRGPNAVRALEGRLTDVWIHLMRAER